MKAFVAWVLVMSVVIPFTFLTSITGWALLLWVALVALASVGANFIVGMIWDA
jgi:hypothetical protein